MAKYLAELGHHVTVVCQKNKPSFCGTNKIIDNVQILSLPSLVTSSKNPFHDLIMQGSTLFAQIGVNCTLPFKSFDIIHVVDALFPQNEAPIVFSKMKIDLSQTNNFCGLG